MKTVSFFIVAVCLLGFFIASDSFYVEMFTNESTAAEKPVATKKESPQKDVGKLLPRIPAKEPQEALKSFQVNSDFELQLIAAEPLLRDPVALDIDENGLMYVVEMPGYNLHDKKEFRNVGAIKLLEDTDNDGTYDKSTVFMDGLYQPTAVACYDGGIFVGVVPHIMYYKDSRFKNSKVFHVKHF